MTATTIACVIGALVYCTVVGYMHYLYILVLIYEAEPISEEEAEYVTNRFLFSLSQF